MLPDTDSMSTIASSTWRHHSVCSRALRHRGLQTCLLFQQQKLLSTRVAAMELLISPGTRMALLNFDGCNTGGGSHDAGIGSGSGAYLNDAGGGAAAEPQRPIAHPELKLPTKKPAHEPSQTSKSYFTPRLDGYQLGPKPQKCQPQTLNLTKTSQPQSWKARVTGRKPREGLGHGCRRPRRWAFGFGCCRVFSIRLGLGLRVFPTRLGFRV